MWTVERKVGRICVGEEDSMTAYDDEVICTRVTWWWDYVIWVNEVWVFRCLPGTYLFRS
jgi:hypothetical protein